MKVLLVLLAFILSAAPASAQLPVELHPNQQALLQSTDPQLAANKKLVAAFVDDILVNGRLDRLAGYYDGDNYHQHNPQIADGLSGLGAALQAMAKAGVTMKYHKVHKVLGEGNFVLVASEGEFAGKPSAFYDLFRVANGKIAEHWDTIETIPPRAEDCEPLEVRALRRPAGHGRGPDGPGRPGRRSRHAQAQGRRRCGRVRADRQGSGA